MACGYVKNARVVRGTTVRGENEKILIGIKRKSGEEMCEGRKTRDGTYLEETGGAGGVMNEKQEKKTGEENMGAGSLHTYPR